MGCLGFGLGLALARLGVAEGGLAAALCGEDLGPLVALGAQDLGLPFALGTIRPAASSMRTVTKLRSLPSARMV